MLRAHRPNPKRIPLFIPPGSADSLSQDPRSFAGSADSLSQVPRSFAGSRPAGPRFELYRPPPPIFADAPVSGIEQLPPRPPRPPRPTTATTTATATATTTTTTTATATASTSAPAPAPVVTTSVRPTTKIFEELNIQFLSLVNIFTLSKGKKVYRPKGRYVRTPITKYWLLQAAAAFADLLDKLNLNNGTSDGKPYILADRSIYALMVLVNGCEKAVSDDLYAKLQIIDKYLKDDDLVCICALCGCCTLEKIEGVVNTPCPKCNKIGSHCVDRPACSVCAKIKNICKEKFLTEGLGLAASHWAKVIIANQVHTKFVNGKRVGEVAIGTDGRIEPDGRIVSYQVIVPIPSGPKPCRFGVGCWKQPHCPFSHPLSSQPPPNPPAKSNTLCAHGIDCPFNKRGDCLFTHPDTDV